MYEELLKKMNQADQIDDIQQLRELILKAAVVILLLCYENDELKQDIKKALGLGNPCYICDNSDQECLFLDKCRPKYHGESIPRIK